MARPLTLILQTARKILNYLVADAGGPNENATRLSVTAETLTELATAETTTIAAQALAVDPATRTPTNIHAANDAGIELDRLNREIQQAIKHHKDVTRPDADAMDINLHTGGGARLPAPSLAAILALILVKTGEVLIEIYAQEPESMNKVAMPHGEKAELHWLFADTKEVQLADDFHIGKTTGRSRAEIPVTEANSGKFLHIKARFVNSRGELGPFGPVIVVGTA